MSNSSMRTIRLYGELGSKFGRSHRYHLDTKTPAEALAALFSQVKGARDYFLNAHKQGIEFAIFVGKRNLSRAHLGLPANDEIRIAPVLRGAKRAGLLQTIAGVVLIVAGAFTSAYGGGYLVSIGVSLVLGGVVQMLTPVPKGRSSKDTGGSESNYNFNGPVNTQAQGNPVPLAYGEVIAGSAVISAGIDVTDNSVVIVGGYQNPKLGYMGGGYWAGGYREIGFIDPEPA